MLEHITNYFTEAFSSPLDIVGQIFGSIATLISLVTFASVHRKRILMTKFASDVLWMFSFLLGGAWSGAVTNGVNSVRDGVFYFKKDSWKRMWFIPAGFIAFYVVSGALAWTGMISLLPMASAFIAVVGLWLTKPLYTRILYIPSALMWIVYSFYTYNIMAAVCNIFYLISIVIGLIKDHKQKKATQNKREEKLC
ncbi:MAG: YgjV family protein [Clostridia bacterium]|nr:YgjV family protein [Clostridia bacterium]